MLNIRTDVNGEAITIAMEGILDSQTTPDLEKVLEENYANVSEINFDFKDLEYLTSAGLRAILVAKQEMIKKGGELTVRNVPRDVMAIFNETGFAALFNIK